MRTSLAVACCGVVLLQPVPRLQGQTTLRWKLNPGEQFAVAIAQNTTSEVAYSDKKTKTQIDLAMELTWRVLAAENGQFRLEQSLDRMSVSLKAPPAGQVQYDTAQQAKPAGSAKEIAAAIAPLLALKLEITMNDRGEVLAAKPLAPLPGGSESPPAAGSCTRRALERLDPTAPQAAARRAERQARQLRRHLDDEQQPDDRPRPRGPDDDVPLRRP